MGSVIANVRLVKEESARISDYLKRLTPDEWSTQSACESWQVRDVVAHLTGSMEMFGGNIARGAAGDASPPEGFPPAGQGDMAARLAGNAQRAVDLRESLGGELLATFDERRTQFDDVLSRLKETDREKPCYHPAGTISVETYLNLRITELIVHEWDIRSRLGPEAVMSPESIPAIIEMFPVFVVGRLFNPGANLPTAARFRFELTGPGSGGHDIVAGGGVKELMEQAGRQQPDVTFGCDTQTFVLLVYGRITLGEAVESGQISVSGDSGLAAQFGH
ncbi:MAG: maleylpyruvate isomerase family mycothiol-dependent enzyme [Chloroflexi bacterium]|nr:maleylpyruvate isomerase family mycothiol-dependent enzyme [Chloroflexota bacterium]